MDTNALKAIGRTDDELRVANYIVLFGGRDLEGVLSPKKNADGSMGEYFTAATELDSGYTKTGRLLVDWEHGRDPSPDGPGEDDPLGYVDWSTAKADTRGVWVERALYRHNKYVQLLDGLIDAGFVGTSSGAVVRKVKTAGDGHIIRWPLKSDTLTMTPMEPRMITENYIQAFKALGIPVPEDKPEPEATPEAGTPAVVAGKATDQPVIKSTMEDTMSEEKENSTTEAPAVDVAAIAKQAADEAVKAYRAELAKEPPITPSGIQVTADEEDKKAAVTTWNMGDFLQAVAHQPEAVRAYKSNIEAGGFDLSKAIGLKKTGTIGAAKQKAITGMSELVPADGGLLVGTDQNLTIMDKIYNSADLLGRVTMTPISAQSNGMTFVRNAESSRALGSRWGGARAYWACEAAEKTISHPTFERVSLELNKIIGYVPATDELLQDASALESYIMSVMPQEIGFQVQDSLIRGTGAGMPQGILGAPCLVTQAAEAAQAADTIVSENVINMWSRRWVGARDYVWLVNQDCTPQLQQMNLGVGAGGMLTYMPPGGLSQSGYGSLFGRPVIEIEQCDTIGDVGDIILASWSEYQMIEKGSIQSASSIHVRFQYDETVFRFVYRTDGKPKWALPLTPFQSALTQGPFVVLAARA